MYLPFSDKEKEWIELDKFGWPVKDGCPQEIKKSIAEKKKILDKQMEQA